MSSFPVCHFLLVFALVIHMKEKIVLLSFRIYTHRLWITILDESCHDTALNALLSPTSAPVSHNILFASDPFNHPSTTDWRQWLLTASLYFCNFFSFWSKHECSHCLKCQLLYLQIGFKVKNLDSLTPLAPICLTSFPWSYCTRTPSRVITIVLMCKSDENGICHGLRLLFQKVPLSHQLWHKWPTC